MRKPPPFVLHGIETRPGERRILELPQPSLYTRTALEMPVQVLHGARPGPAILLCAALHGDEINGIEIIRESIAMLDPVQLHGTIVSAPVVNLFGFLNQSRYLPDRRDLNRSFPGSAEGSLASRLAHQFFHDVVSRCTHCIDLHTAAMNRDNLPQVRGDLRDPETRRLALAFGAPVLVHAATRDGSLREAASEAGIPVLLYEGGEPLRFNRDAIRVGVRGVVRVLRALRMTRRRNPYPAPEPPYECAVTKWIRARQSGVLRLEAELGAHVSKGQILGVIGDPFGEVSVKVRAPSAGVIIGKVSNPLVHRGDAIVHIGVAAQRPAG